VLRLAVQAVGGSGNFSYQRGVSLHGGTQFFHWGQGFFKGCCWCLGAAAQVCIALGNLCAGRGHPL